MKKFIAVALIGFGIVLTGCSKTAETPPTDETAITPIPAAESPAAETPSTETSETTTTPEAQNPTPEPEAPQAEVPQTRVARMITVDAKFFEFTPSVIRVKAGEIVTLQLNNVEGTHSISVPALGLMSGDKIVLKDVAKGTYNFMCATYCGEGHGQMKGTLIVE